MAKGNEITGVVTEVKRISGPLIIVLICIIFMLGWLCHSKKTETVTFTYEEIQMIETFQQQLNDKIDSKAEVVVYKDKDGNLLMGWK